MSKLLINESPLQVLPSLAIKIGLNEAIILQQIHYWLYEGKSGKIVDGRRWIFNSIRLWKETNFPFWSEATIKRAIGKLIKIGLVEARGDLNKKGFDKTKWYTINYDRLSLLENEPVTKPLGQNDQTIGSNCSNGIGQNDQTNTIDYTETTTESIPTPDFLDDVFNQQGKVSEVTGPNPDDQWFEYSSRFLKIFQGKTGRYPNPDEKAAISEIAAMEGADLSRWEKALAECNLNYTGHKCPVSRTIEVYQSGGTWADWQKWRGKQDEKPAKPENEREKIIDPLTGKWSGGYYV